MKTDKEIAEATLNMRLKFERQHLETLRKRRDMVDSKIAITLDSIAKIRRALKGT